MRRFTHGGLLRFLTRERFRDPSRPFRELAVADSLARAGVRTPQVAAARARPASGWGWKLEIVTRRIDGAVDLDHVLAEVRAGRIPRDDLRRLARPAGEFVRAMHDAGCVHADLTTKNVLVESAALAGAPPRWWILDLDRARVDPAISSADRVSNLARLHRYVERRERMHGPAITGTTALRFLAGYEPDRARRAATARAILAEHARSRRWHALGWKLEGLFARD